MFAPKPKMLYKLSLGNNPTLFLLQSIVCCKQLTSRCEAYPIQPVTTYRAILDPQQEWEGEVVFTVQI